MPVRLGFKAEDIIAEGRVTNDDINKIKDWLRINESLPVISDEEIVNFLLSNDNDEEKTKNTIKAYFKIRNEAPEMFNNRIISNENFQTNQFATYISIAPKRTKDNCAVIFAQIYDPRFQNFHLAQVYKFVLMALDAAIYCSPPNGLIIVIDIDKVGLMHLTKLRINAISIFFRYLQEALPVKLKNIHILNTPYFIDKALAIMKPFMSDHITQLMILHERKCNMDEFYEKYVAKEFLPDDFGGELPCMKVLSEQFTEKLKSMKSYFTAEEDRRSILKSTSL